MSPVPPALPAGALLEPQFSVVVPALNEAATITAQLDRLRALRGPYRFEIIVADGAPEADTLAAIAAEDVRKISAPLGRARQMNAGAEAARGDVLLFVHADTELPPDALQAIARAAAVAGGDLAGAFTLAIDSQRWILRLIAWGANVRARLTRIAYGDQCFFIARGLFHKLGGFEDIPLMEDVAIMRRLKREGIPLALLPERVKTSARRWEKEGAAYSTLRNWSLAGLYLLGVSPARLVRFFRHGKQLYGSAGTASDTRACGGKTR